MNIEITPEDLIESNITLIYSFVYDSMTTTEKEKKIKNLLLAKKTIEKTLNLLGFTEV